MDYFSIPGEVYANISLILVSLFLITFFGAIIWIMNSAGKKKREEMEEKKRDKRETDDNKDLASVSDLSYSENQDKADETSSNFQEFLDKCINTYEKNKNKNNFWGKF